MFLKRKKTEPTPVPKILYTEPEGTVPPMPKPKPKPLDFQRGEFLVLGPEIRELHNPLVNKRSDGALMMTIYSLNTEGRNHPYAITPVTEAKALDLNPETTNAPRYNPETGFPSFPEGYSATSKVVGTTTTYRMGIPTLLDVVDVSLEYDPPMSTTNMADMSDAVQTLHTWKNVTRANMDSMYRTTMSRERLYMYLLAAANMAWKHSANKADNQKNAELYGTFK